MIHKHFNTPQAFVAACTEAKVSFGSGSWYGYCGSEKAMKLACSGEESRVAKAQALVDEFSGNVDLGQVYPRWEPSVAGAFPIIPAYLAGMPQTMMRRQLVRSERAPVTLWVCVTSSGGIETEQVEARGIAIMALAMALSQIPSGGDQAL